MESTRLFSAVDYGSHLVGRVVGYVLASDQQAIAWNNGLSFCVDLCVESNRRFSFSNTQSSPILLPSCTATLTIIRYFWLLEAESSRHVLSCEFE